MAGRPGQDETEVKLSAVTGTTTPRYDPSLTGVPYHQDTVHMAGWWVFAEILKPVSQ
jgi:hypothetical protein